MQYQDRMKNKDVANNCKEEEVSYLRKIASRFP